MENEIDLEYLFPIEIDVSETSMLRCLKKTFSLS